MLFVNNLAKIINIDRFPGPVSKNSFYFKILLFLDIFVTTYVSSKKLKYLLICTKVNHKLIKDDILDVTQRCDICFYKSFLSSFYFSFEGGVFTSWVRDKIWQADKKELASLKSLSHVPMLKSLSIGTSWHILWFEKYNFEVHKFIIILCNV